MHSNLHSLLAEEISSYLDEHPEAADSAEGIAQWWLAWRYLHRTHRDVEVALQVLQTQGRIITRRGRDGSLIYQSARSGRNEGRTGDSGAKPGC